jgi:hypothetical protein
MRSLRGSEGGEARKKEVRFGIAGIQSSNDPDLLIKLSARSQPILRRVPSMDALDEGFSSGVFPKTKCGFFTGGISRRSFSPQSYEEPLNQQFLL